MGLTLKLALLPALALACCGAFAQTKPEVQLPSVSATAVRDPVDKSYRKMLKGMDLFEEKQSMAPNASLRYKLLPRRRETTMNNISLDIVGETVAIAVPVARDHTFTLERDQKALDENASVIPNRASGSMTWRTEIRTPGLPPNTRRLGDLRLECLVGMEAGLISNVKPVFGQIANLLMGAMDYCGQVDSEYLFFAERPIFGVTLVNGARREVISIDRLYAGASYDTNLKAELPYCDCEVLVDRTYFLPLGDRSWPDDTLVQFEYMEDADGRQPARADASG
jgi:hypothetical protein